MVPAYLLQQSSSSSSGYNPSTVYGLNAVQLPLTTPMEETETPKPIEEELATPKTERKLPNQKGIALKFRKYKTSRIKVS